MNVEWDNGEVPKGYTMPFVQALATGEQGLLLRLALPNWLICLTKRGREALRGYHKLEVGDLSTSRQQPNLRLDFRNTY